MAHYRITQVEDYEPLIGTENVERIREKARQFKGLRIVELLKDKKLCEKIGCEARETVREKFLLTRYVEQYLDLFGSFDKDFRLRD